MSYTNGLDKPSDYFNTKLYTGTGAEHNITGVGFQPDWTWIKERNNVTSHRVFDIIRGATVEMFPDLTDGESSDAQSLKSFDSDGFTLGTDGATNGSSDTYASWNWLASNTTASNTDGDITSTVSANTTSGFSIVTWTGTGSAGTLGHGLGSTPKMIIVKCRSDADTWAGYHVDVGATKYMELDTTAAAQTSTQPWNDTEPTSLVFTVGNWSATNGSGRTYIAYCFSEVKGFSKFGSYVANASNDGPMIYLGFKPAFVIIKRTSNTNPWILLDNKRGSFNVNQSKLFPNSSDAENTDTSNGIDFLSNGFKIRRNNTEINGASGDTFIYMAFAEEPLVGDNPATAR